MFTFGPYTLRATTAEDADHCLRWIAGDKHHAGKTSVDFFVNTDEHVAERDKNVEKMVVELSATGERIFYFTVEHAIRVHIQYGPSETPEDRDKNRAGMEVGFGWLLDRAQQTGYREVLFQTNEPLLARFVQRRIGFVASQGEQVRRITAPQAVQQQK